MPLPFFAPRLALFLLALAWVGIDGRYLAAHFSELYSRLNGPAAFRTLFDALHRYGLALLALGALVQRFFLYVRTGYGITSRRVLFREGGGWQSLWGKDLTSLDVSARSWESLFDIGTVRCYDGTRKRCGQVVAHSLRWVAAPYDVYERLEILAPQAKSILGVSGLWKGPEKVVRPPKPGVTVD